MSRDFQFISVVDDLQVVGVEEIADAIPRAIRVIGDRGFNSAQRVEINSFGVDDFIIVSDTLLLVSPPDSVFGAVSADQMRVVVVAGQLTSTRKARLVFGPTRRTRTVEGTQKLIQQVVKEFISDVGSNRFRPGDGGNILRMFGKTLTSAGQTEIAAALSQGASRVQEAFLTRQALSRKLQPSERLLKFEVSGVQFNAAASEVVAQLRLVTFVGRSFEIPLVL